MNHAYIWHWDQERKKERCYENKEKRESVMLKKNESVIEWKRNYYSNKEKGMCYR